ncbi:uncharacterized protein VTP21DRAFT_4427 [Calcarisporiella thermophila]|uniref:uncharacterized protein n=1 Tax=Calcarisporiella thermophila TaxID=911321 RepID=UPI0037437163
MPINTNTSLCPTCKLTESDCACHPSSSPRKSLAVSRSLQSIRSKDFLSTRLTPTTIHGLYPGSRFKGEQRSQGSTYDVMVEIQHVDLSDSFLCGYLHISGLTEDHPELTTFFEAEIIGPRYSFLTRKWDADAYIDLEHWKQFVAFQPYERMFKKDNRFVYDSKDHIFMRWKERFLVPDHRVDHIAGASFAGFYYISYNVQTGHISGLYYHSNSIWFQLLSLHHEPDRCAPVFEFR